MNHPSDGQFAAPRQAAGRPLEIKSPVAPVQGGRIHIEKINLPFPREGGSPAEYKAGLDLAIANGWLWLHESGTFVRFAVTPLLLRRRQRRVPWPFRAPLWPARVPCAPEHSERFRNYATRNF